MEAVNGVAADTGGGNGSDGITRGSSGPPAPSPLTGCYLLIVIGEPHSKEHADIILQRIAKGERPLTVSTPSRQGFRILANFSRLGLFRIDCEMGVGTSVHCDDNGADGDADRSMIVPGRQVHVADKPQFYPFFLINVVD